MTSELDHQVNDSRDQVSVRLYHTPCRYVKHRGWCWKGPWRVCQLICWAPTSFQKEVLIKEKHSLCIKHSSRHLTCLIHFILTILNVVVTTIIPTSLMRNLKHWEITTNSHSCGRTLSTALEFSPSFLQQPCEERLREAVLPLGHIANKWNGGPGGFQTHSLFPTQYSFPKTSLPFAQALNCEEI